MNLTRAAVLLVFCPITQYIYGMNSEHPQEILFGEELKRVVAHIAATDKHAHTRVEALSVLNALQDKEVPTEPPIKALVKLLVQLGLAGAVRERLSNAGDS